MRDFPLSKDVKYQELLEPLTKKGKEGEIWNTGSKQLLTQNYLLLLVPVLGLTLSSPLQAVSHTGTEMSGCEVHTAGASVCPTAVLYLKGSITVSATGSRTKSHFLFELLLFDTATTLIVIGVLCSSL